MIITVSREYGAGGSEVARRVAASLGWRLVDNELVEQVAARCGLSPDAVAQLEERAPSFVERVARSFVAATPEIVPAGDALPTVPEADLVSVTEAVVADLAANGDVVFVGRATAAVLATERDALHVRVVAPREHRIGIIAARLGVGAAEARTAIDQTDAMRRRYHRQYYNRDWDDPTIYHLVLNTAALGLDGAAALIVHQVTRS